MCILDESEDTVVDSTMEELLLKPLEMAMQGVPGMYVAVIYCCNLRIQYIVYI